MVGTIDLVGTLTDSADGLIGGSLACTITLSDPVGANPNYLATHLGSFGVQTGTFCFAEALMTIAALKPNSFVDDPANTDPDIRIMTLWGANGDNASYAISTIVSDIRFRLTDTGGGTSTPEPMTVALLGMGLLPMDGMTARHRRNG